MKNVKSEYRFKLYLKRLLLDILALSPNYILHCTLQKMFVTILVVLVCPKKERCEHRI